MSKIKLVCNNKACINKSIVWRRFDTLKEYRCKLCDWLLVAARASTVMQATRDQKAKSDLEVLGE